jgi:hypothetical protein
MLQRRSDHPAEHHVAEQPDRDPGGLCRHALSLDDAERDQLGHPPRETCPLDHRHSRRSRRADRPPAPTRRSPRRPGPPAPHGTLAPAARSGGEGAPGHHGDRQARPAERGLDIVGRERHTPVSLGDPHRAPRHIRTSHSSPCTEASSMNCTAVMGRGEMLQFRRRLMRTGDQRLSTTPHTGRARATDATDPSLRRSSYGEEWRPAMALPKPTTRSCGTDVMMRTGTVNGTAHDVCRVPAVAAGLGALDSPPPCDSSPLHT